MINKLMFTAGLPAVFLFHGCVKSDNIGFSIQRKVSGGLNNTTVTCTTGDCKNGYSEKFFSHGGYDKGYYQGGELNGSGERHFGLNTDFAEDTYIGEFINGEFNGFGKYTDVSNNIYVEGYWIDGQRDKSKSTLFWTDLDLPILSKKME